MGSDRVSLVACAMFCVAFLVAGCVGAGPTNGRAHTNLGAAFHTSFQVLNATDGEPVFLAQVTLMGAQGPLVAIATDQNGTAPIDVPSDARAYAVRAAGYAPRVGNFSSPVARVVVKLAPLSDPNSVADAVGLVFRPPVDLGSKKYPVAVGTSCLSEDALGDRDGDCGLAEPEVEVDARGTIYVSGVCCIGDAPPVYVSRDDGKTFKELTTTTGVREKFGIEGDFAIDADGVVYFSDIEFAATFQVTAWDKDGTFLRHMKWPAPPLVDRDWIRADGKGHLYYAYNTGSNTNVYTSLDGGQTWSPKPVFQAPYGLGNEVKGRKPGELWLLGGSATGTRRADYTTDGGATWTMEKTSAPTGGNFPTGAFDSAGNMYVTGGKQDAVYVAHRGLDGKWAEPVMVSPNVGHHRFPWIAAGGSGKSVVAWYGTLDEKSDAKWYLFVAASLDADAPIPHWAVAVADPTPVLVGDLQRQLLDFLQTEIGPDGSVHVAYSKLDPNEPNHEEQLHYVHSEPMPYLASKPYANGPVP